MAKERPKSDTGAAEVPSSVSDPQVFQAGQISLTKIEPGETHSDIGLDCESGIPWTNQHLERFQIFFNTREDGKAAVAFSLANPLVAELKTAITLAAQDSAVHPPV